MDRARPLARCPRRAPSPPRGALTILLGGSVITISGGGTVRVFSVDPCVTFTVESLTIANGNNAGSGGAIHSNFPGVLTVMNSTFSGHTPITHSNPSPVTNSPFSGNSAGSGGAIFSEGPVTMTNSILANSTSGGNCGVFGGATITDGGHNIDDGTTCGFTGTGCPTTTGTSFCNTPP